MLIKDTNKKFNIFGDIAARGDGWGAGVRSATVSNGELYSRSDATSGRAAIF